MAGSRRTRADRAKAWRARYLDRARQASSSTDLAPLAAAVDYLRTALSRCATPEQRDQVVTATTAELVARAEGLITAYESKGSRR